MHDISEDISKAELHVHIEGTLRPAMAQALAARNGVTLDPSLFDDEGGYRYRDFLDLVTHTYQAVAECMRTARDYEDIVFNYLSAGAAEGVIYTELIACPGQCARTGISYRDMVDGIAAGIDRARSAAGIEARINMAFERHRPGAEAEKDAALILSYPHSYVVGLDIAGGEHEGDFTSFTDLWQRVREEFSHRTGRTLGVRMHAGEAAGPANVWAALEMGATRIGHGVRSIEDPALIDELVRRGTVLEICPTSNIMLIPAYGGDYARHPLRRLYEAGVKVTINSDDPGLFGSACTIGGEYRIAAEKFGFTPGELRDLTRNSIESAFLDRATRLALLEKITPSSVMAGPAA